MNIDEAIEAVVVIIFVAVIVAVVLLVTIALDYPWSLLR